MRIINERLDSSGKDLTDLLYGFRLERRDAFSRNGNQKTAPPLQPDGQGGRRNRDFSIFPPDVQRQSRLQSGLPPNLFRNDQPSRVIDGRPHGIKYTIIFTISQVKRRTFAKLCAPFLTCTGRRRAVQRTCRVFCTASPVAYACILRYKIGEPINNQGELHGTEAPG